ncbi:MAG: helix-turn-helix domain-containing protein [Acidimicrobiales bacterium]|jgi:DNA-binding IclR family transcriptional regulator|nr:helix-turn-helix domain-containing protein [Acidimicrobiales bacterium]
MSTVKEIQSVRNACTVVEAIARTQPIGVSDLARTTGIDKSAAHRLAVTLHAAGWLDRAAGSRWALSPVLAARLGRAGLGALLEGALPLLHEARSRTGETAMLVVPHGQRLVIVRVVESEQNLRVSSAEGAEMPARSSSALRALAAHLDDDQLDAWREIDPDLSDAMLGSVREHGYAVNDAEVLPDTRAVGAALVGADGPVAVVVVTGPTTRFGREQIPVAGAVVAELAARWAADR